MRIVISIILMIVAGLLSVGCAASKPAHYYTIQPPSQPTAQTALPRGDLTLLMGEIATPEALQDGRIRYRIGDNEMGAYEYHRWTDRPGLMVRDSLMRALKTSGNYRIVSAAGSSAAGDYLVRGKLNEFDEVDGATIKTRISLQLELIDRKTNRSVWDSLLEHEEPVARKDVSSVVQSLDRNLQNVATQAAREINGFLDTRH